MTFFVRGYRRVIGSLEAVNENMYLHHVYYLTKKIKYYLRLMLVKKKKKENLIEDDKVYNNQHRYQIQLNNILFHYDELE